MLPKTNMTADEMVPDVDTPGHDPRFWCLPPKRGDFDEVVPLGGGFEFHLVTAGRQVGVWRDWTVAQTMVTGYPSNGHKGHHSYAGCVREWQQFCPLGVHPHPGDPARSSASAGMTNDDTTLHEKGKERQARQASASAARHARRSLSSPASTVPGPSRAIAAPGGSSPKYFAIWGGGVVYSSRYAAKMAFDDVVEEGEEAELLSTGDFDIALAYAEGDV
ncbi:hypothetical protein B0H13DRAFT_1856651 [Mycena leptocephala]|nr:hypothetical protein B0H13DRAFT_1856605 [Mycena leptocephala]KAJ7933052.1 hypothetical protein B0H13DRAFT_1856651 [Mycena leptocephala]